MNDPTPTDSNRRPDWLHVAIVFTELLSAIPPLLITPALAGIAAIAAWPWRDPSLQIATGALVALAIATDGLSLSLLPRHERSFGPVTPPLLALALLRATLAFVTGALWPTWPALGLTALGQLALTAAQVYATWIEPFRLTTTCETLRTPKLEHGPPLRLLHLSDVHFEGWTPRERALVERVQGLTPDLILITGDYLNLSSIQDPAAQAGVRELLAQIAACAPTFAITGSPPVDLPDVVPAIFAGLPITWLQDETADVRASHHTLRLVGVRCTKQRASDGARLHRLLPDGAGDRFTILLYHSPDLIHAAAEIGVDLYLAGHTHGGQLRLPLFGAVVTSSDFWKQYEAGRYRHGPTTLYVSRGLGMEGLGAPRARFLAPPEVIVWEIEATH
ncbi:MAG: metallophosphoesterase [Anaerolineae bacterium]|nr:metallophosphoesterase [Anaerolineae bacterium]